MRRRRDLSTRFLSHNVRGLSDDKLEELVSFMDARRTTAYCALETWRVGSLVCDVGNYSALWVRMLVCDGGHQPTAQQVPQPVRAGHVSRFAVANLAASDLAGAARGEQLGLRSIGFYATQRRLRWAGHVVRMPEVVVASQAAGVLGCSSAPRGRPATTYGHALVRTLRAVANARDEDADVARIAGDARGRLDVWGAYAADRARWRAFMSER